MCCEVIFFWFFIGLFFFFNFGTEISSSVLCKFLITSIELTPKMPRNRWCKFNCGNKCCTKPRFVLTPKGRQLREDCLRPTSQRDFDSGAAGVLPDEPVDCPRYENAQNQNFGHNFHVPSHITRRTS